MDGYTGEATGDFGCQPGKKLKLRKANLDVIGFSLHLLFRLSSDLAHFGRYPRGCTLTHELNMDRRQPSTFYRTRRHGFCTSLA